MDGRRQRLHRDIKGRAYQENAERTEAREQNIEATRTKHERVANQGYVGQLGAMIGVNLEDMFQGYELPSIPAIPQLPGMSSVEDQRHQNPDQSDDDVEQSLDDGLRGLDPNPSLPHFPGQQVFEAHQGDVETPYGTYPLPLGGEQALVSVGEYHLDNGPELDLSVLAGVCATEKDVNAALDAMISYRGDFSVDRRLPPHAVPLPNDIGEQFVASHIQQMRGDSVWDIETGTEYRLGSMMASVEALSHPTAEEVEMQGNFRSSMVCPGGGLREVIFQRASAHGGVLRDIVSSTSALRLGFEGYTQPPPLLEGEELDDFCTEWNIALQRESRREVVRTVRHQHLANFERAQKEPTTDQPQAMSREEMLRGIRELMGQSFEPVDGDKDVNASGEVPESTTEKLVSRIDQGDEGVSDGVIIGSTEGVVLGGNEIERPVNMDAPNHQGNSLADGYDRFLKQVQARRETVSPTAGLLQRRPRMVRDVGCVDNTVRVTSSASAQKKIVEESTNRTYEGSEVQDRAVQNMRSRIRRRPM